MLMINPNCSEVVGKLPVKTIKEAKKILKDIDIEVIRYDAYIHLHAGTKFSEKHNRIIDPSNPNSPDFANRSSIGLYRGNYEGGNGVYVVGHQHCQRQLFATIEKISGEIKVDFHGYDGGYDFEDCYNEWLEREEDVKDLQKAVREEVEIILAHKSMQEIKDGLFFTINIITGKKYSDGEKYKHLVKIVEKIMNERKKELVGKRRKETKKMYDKVVKETGITDTMKQESDDDIFKHLKQFYHWQYTEPLFICITQPKIRKVFLHRDELFKSQSDPETSQLKKPK